MSKENKTIDVVPLADALKKRRKDEKLSLRDVQAQIKINSSTLSRIENLKGTPDAETIRILTGWLDMPIESVMKSPAVEAVISYPNQSTPDVIAGHLQRDKSLSPKAAEGLTELFRVAYTQMTEVQNENI